MVTNKKKFYTLKFRIIAKLFLVFDRTEVETRMDMTKSLRNYLELKVLPPLLDQVCHSIVIYKLVHNSSKHFNNYVTCKVTKKIAL